MVWRHGPLDLLAETADHASATEGNLGNNTVVCLGTWRFDVNLGKTLQLAESKTLRFRMDAQNVLNHPQPANPNLSITSEAPFRQITSKASGRIMQGQLRLSF